MDGGNGGRGMETDTDTDTEVRTGARSALSRLWHRRWGPVGSRLILATFIVGASTLSTFTFTAGGTGADTSFNLGTASAGATAINIAPALAQLSVAVELGASQADYEFSEAQGLADTLNLGVIGTILEEPSCTNGAPSAVQASDFPASIQAESTTGNESLHSVAETSLNGTGAGVGDEDASATQTPAGTATTTIASDDLAGLVDVLGATTSATTEVLNGNERYATATADIASISIAKGLIQLKGLHWVATQTSGATSSSTASFDVGGLSIAGVNIDLSNNSITTLLQIINTALEATGFEIDWPTTTTEPDGTISISPLTVGVDNSALGQEIVGANLGTIEPVRNELDTELFGLDCNLPGYVEVVDVLTGVPAGGGTLNIQLGGAHAVTDDVVASDPFGSGGLASLPSVSTPVGGLQTPSSVLPTTSSGFTAPTVAPSTATAPTSAPSGAHKVSLGPISRTVSCHSVGPAGGGCGASNVALPVGLIGLGILALLAGWDFVRQRRRAELAAIRGEAG
jgi:hypothetical protein